MSMHTQEEKENRTPFDINSLALDRQKALKLWECGKIRNDKMKVYIKLMIFQDAIVYN